MTQSASHPFSEETVECPLMLFPHVLVFPYSAKPIQISTPEQQAAIELAMTTNEVVALGVMSAGGALPNCDSCPSQLKHGILARISIAQQNAEGQTQSVVLRGLTRTELEHLPTEDGKPPRVRATAIPDRYPSPAAIDRQRRRSELLDLYRECVPRKDRFIVEGLVQNQLSLGCLSDILAQGSRLPSALSTEFLKLTNVDHRSDLLLDHLRLLQRQPASYAPDFSEN
ncbi:MAG: LON peptidase substrate-binding domain-containing protein [Planctomycetaceae bacterium]